jgi:uncharacterized protein YdhG (YjbR/CyaY superfamily)
MSVIDDYLNQFNPEVRNELERIRSIAKKLLPGCEETISYRMPTLKYKGESIIGFNAHKNYIGIYPYSGSVISKIKELQNNTGTKSAVHESLDLRLSDAIIEKIVRERLKQAGI